MVVMKTYTPKFPAASSWTPHTGEIIAIAARPAYDPNSITRHRPSVFSDSLVEGRYGTRFHHETVYDGAGIDSGKR